MGGQKQLKIEKLVCKSGRFQEVVTYERWSPTRGSIYSNLTWKLFVFWKSGRLREVVAKGGSTVFTEGIMNSNTTLAFKTVTN